MPLVRFVLVIGKWIWRCVFAPVYIPLKLLSYMIPSKHLESSKMSDIERVLSGEACSTGPVHFRDENSEDNKFKPVVKYNMGYIVGAIVFSEDNTHVLLVQEAKDRCRGLWYYPVGRLEPNETLLEGAKREVKEEAGVDITPTKLLCVETTSGSWFRFTFTGPISGELKTTPDKESLKASWAPIKDILEGNESQFPLRQSDFIPLIIEKQREVSCSTIPALLSHKQLLLRVLFVTENKGEIYYVEHDGRLPVLMLSPFKSMLWIIHRFCEAVFHTTLPYKIIGVLSVEHSASAVGETDGMCFSILVQYTPGTDHHTSPISSPSKENLTSDTLLSITDKYQWRTVEEGSMKEQLLHKLQPQHTVPLSILR